jgi:hypothetical protein
MLMDFTLRKEEVQRLHAMIKEWALNFIKTNRYNRTSYCEQGELIHALVKRSRFSGLEVDKRLEDSLVANGWKLSKHKGRKSFASFGQGLPTNFDQGSDAEPTRVQKEKVSRADSGHHSEEREETVVGISEMNLRALTIESLKPKLKALGLKVSGKKADLVERLEAHTRGFQHGGGDGDKFKKSSLGFDSDVKATDMEVEDADPSSEDLMLHSLSVKALKAELKAVGLKVSGRKAELIERLQGHRR